MLAGQNGQKILDFEQHSDGCVITAEIPSDVWSFAGALVVSVRDSADGGTSVEAATRIRGQMYDWGKSKRVLNALFSGIPHLAAFDDHL